MINYNTVKQIYNSHFGSEKLYKRNYCNSLSYTEGIMDFQKTLNAYWVVDNVISYMPAVLKSFSETENDFYIVSIAVNQDNSGYMEVYTEGYLDGEYQEHINITKQKIPFIDLPLMIDKEVTTYKFFLELTAVEPVEFTLLLPREH